ncbi:T-lymphocyte surface antigen Ly-9-like [Centroberyx affinis]|uniref:T-lymphocyte surface antigen Ly-9-like n=1 Tax=Centroberyx affinis TaxID=166261 RepID=UPI003A5C1E82
MEPRILLLILFLLIGTVAEEIKTLKKRVGETVTLHLKKNRLNSDTYVWNYGLHSPINSITIVFKGDIIVVNGTRFTNRLQTHVETGSITIYNLTISDTGHFMVQFATNTELWDQEFYLIVCDNLIISVNVLVEGNATLDTPVAELQPGHDVKWIRGPECTGKLIARWKNNITTLYDEGFRGALQLNPHTGSLTFMKVKHNYTGHYCLKMLLDEGPYILRLHFITVFESVPTPHISTAQVNITAPSLKDRSCSIDCSVEDAQNVTLSWYRGEKMISQTSNCDICTTNVSLPLKIQDEDIYSCKAANPVSAKTIKVNSTQWCPSHAPGKTGTVAAGVIVVFLVIVVIFAVAYQQRCRRNQ